MPETLDSLRKAADKARRTGCRRLPNALKRRAVDLLGQHTAREVAEAVRVSRGEVVEAWQARLGAKAPMGLCANESHRPPSTFVEVPGSTLGVDVDPEIEVELIGGHGLRIRGRLGPAQLRALVAATLECTGGASCSK